MKVRASFMKHGKWWVAWTEDVPGALTQGATLEEARENLVDAIRMIQGPVDLSQLPKSKVVVEEIEVWMKRRELIRHLERFGCVLVREGAKHSRYINLANPRRSSTVPRHTEIDELLARKICDQLGIPGPKWMFCLPLPASMIYIGWAY
jgi:mRNA interferase HicA